MLTTKTPRLKKNKKKETVYPYAGGWLSMGMVSRQMLMRTPSTPLLPGICTYSFHCIDYSPRNLRACSSPPVSPCAMLPCFQGLLWLFRPDPCIVYSLFLIYQSLESLMSPKNPPSSLCDELCSTATGIIGALCNWRSSMHILIATIVQPLH